MILLLLMMVVDGSVRFGTLAQPTMEECVRVAPIVASMAPYKATVTCLYLKTDRDIDV